ncbi:NUDIX hydrolase domain-like protein [Morchella snyderi]|nr:NUDIX hydrolase domain-like protein [Morchella snyderi]
MASYTATRKLYTLIVPVDVDSQRVLLGYKKRGFGEGKYNGFGGKVEPGETIAEGAIRELEEEACIKAKNLPYHGILFLESTADSKAPILEIHVFTATEWTGEPMETEEMRPKWFAPPSTTHRSSDSPAIPFHNMWEESCEWLPLVLGFYFPTPRRGKIQFAHHVTFKGGLNPETGLEDIWHGIDRLDRGGQGAVD